MTREKFIACIEKCGFRKCYDEGTMSLFERGGIYLFLFDDKVCGSRENPFLSFSYSDIKTLRFRRGSFEIELFSSPSLTLFEDDDIKIGCMG